MSPATQPFWVVWVRSIGLDSSRGVLGFTSSVYGIGDESNRPLGWRYHALRPAPQYPMPVSRNDRLNLRFGGAQLRYMAGTNTNDLGSELDISLPLWLFGLFAIPPVLWVRRWRRKGGRGFPMEVP